MLYIRSILIYYFRFGINPLDDFHKHLSAGHFRPDIKKTRTKVKKAQKKKSLFEERKRAYELTEELLKSRESLLSNAYNQGFNQPTRPVSKPRWRKPKPTLGKNLTTISSSNILFFILSRITHSLSLHNVILVDERTQLRYQEELNAINSEVGASSGFLPSDSQSDDEDGNSSCLLTPAQASTGGKLQQQLQLLQQQQRRKKRAALVAQQQQPFPVPTRAMHLR